MLNFQDLFKNISDELDSSKYGSTAQNFWSGNSSDKRDRNSSQNLVNIQKFLSGIRNNFNTTGNVANKVPITGRDVDNVSKSLLGGPKLGFKNFRNMGADTLNMGSQFVRRKADDLFLNPQQETGNAFQDTMNQYYHDFELMGGPGLKGGAKIALQGKAFGSPQTLVSSTAPYMSFNTTLSSLIGTARGEGKDAIANESGSSFGENLQMAGVISYTNPEITRLLKNLKITNFFAKAGTTGVVNIYEDDLVAAINDKKNTWENRVVAFLIPGLMDIGGKAMNKFSKPIVEAFQKYNADKLLSTGVANDIIKAQEINGHVKFRLPGSPQWVSKTDAISHIKGVQEAAKSAGKDMKVDTTQMDKAKMAEEVKRLGKKMNGGNHTVEDIAKLNKLMQTLSDNEVNAVGAFLGVEPYKDEDGNWKVRYNPGMSVIGMGLTSPAGRKAVGDLGGKTLDDAFKDQGGKIDTPSKTPIGDKYSEFESKLGGAETPNQVRDIRKDMSEYERLRRQGVAKDKVATKVVPNEPLPAKINNVSNKFATREDVISGRSDAKVNLEASEAYIKTIVDDLDNFKKENNINEEDFIKAIESKKQQTGKMGEAVGMHKALMNKLHDFLEAPDVGKVDAYYPRQVGPTSKEMELLFGDHFINRINLELGHMKSRTGKLTDYSTDYKLVMHDYAEQAAYKKYGDLLTSDPVEKAIIDNVKRADPKEVYEYTDKVDVSENKPVIDYEVRASIGKKGFIDAEDRIMRGVGGEVYEKYRAVRDGFDDGVDVMMRKAQPSIDNKNLDGFLKVIKEYGKLSDAMISRLKKHAPRIINKRGFQNFAYKVVKYINKEKSVRDFMEVASKYDYTDIKTKRVVNQVIDTRLKENRLEIKTTDKILNAINRWFQVAHLGLSPKTALAQKLESVRIVAVYGAETAGKAAALAIKEGKRLIADYGFSEKNIYYEPEGKTKLGEVTGKARDATFILTRAMEQYKNVEFIAAAEITGKQKGLKGVELQDFVRDQVVQYAHVARSYNTPIFMRDSAVARSLLQYSQFAIKNVMGKADAMEEKDTAKLLKLLTADAVNAAILSVVTGTPFVWAIKNMFPNGFGPLVTFPYQVASTAHSIYKDKQEGTSTAYEEKKLKRTLIQNAPLGTQGYRTGNTLDILNKGYETNTSGGIQYLAPDNPLDAAMGLTFGANAMSPAREYYKPLSKGGSGGTALGKNQSELVKQTSKPDRKKVFSQFIQDRRDNRAEKDIEKGVEKSGEAALSEEYYYYYEDGKTQKIALNRKLDKPELTSSNKLDYEVLKDYKSDVGSKMNDVVELYKQGILSEKQAQNQLLQLQAEYDRTNNMMKALKSLSGGGSSKKFGKGVGKSPGADVLSKARNKSIASLYNNFKIASPPNIGKIIIDIEGMGKVADNMEAEGNEFTYDSIKLPSMKGIR